MALIKKKELLFLSVGLILSIYISLAIKVILSNFKKFKTIPFYTTFLFTIAMILLISYLIARISKKSFCFCLFLESLCLTPLLLVKFLNIPPVLVVGLTLPGFISINTYFLLTIIRLSINPEYYKILFWIMFLVITAISIILPVLRQNTFKTYEWDLGAHLRVIHETSKGNILYSCHYNTSFLGFHFAPIMTFLSFIYFFLPFPETILIIQSIFVYVSILPVYFLFKKYKLNLFYFSILMAMLLYPALAYICLDDFHPVAMGILPSMLFIKSIITKNKRLALFSVAFGFMEGKQLLCVI